MDKGRLKAIENSMMCLAIFSRSIHIFFSIYKQLEHLDYGTGNCYPFRSICNALLGDAAINWCKVFGSNAEETHWKNIVDDHQAFRKILFSEMNTTSAEFHSYWNDMTIFRSNVIAHFNFENFSQGSVPEFDTAIKSASIAHKYLMEELPDNINYVGPTDLISYGELAARLAMEKIHI